MTAEQEAKIAKLMAHLYVNTMAAIEKFAIKDMIDAELASYDVRNIADELIHLAQEAQEEERDA